MKAFVPREGQREILDYEGGLMGVSAVPGSGKTATIVALATRLIEEGRAGDGQVLIVTYQTAAVDNVRSRIRQALEEMGRLQIGYDVRTLHSLSYSIVRANPGLAGIGSEFSVLDDPAQAPTYWTKQCVCGMAAIRGYGRIGAGRLLR